MPTSPAARGVSPLGLNQPFTLFLHNEFRRAELCVAPFSSRRSLVVNLLNRFAADDSGATAIEYGLIAALIAVAIIAALNTLSGNLKNTFNYVGNQLTTATTN